jgi:uncharacterized protein involved in exopolysaccharide biosynthesis
MKTHDIAVVHAEREPNGQSGPPLADASPRDSLSDLTRAAYVGPLLLRHRWLILAIGVGAAIANGIILLNQPPLYSSATSFVSHGSKGPTSMSGLASQFGLALAMTESWQSPAFLIEVIRSRSVLGPVADSAYCAPCDPNGAPQPFARLIGVRGRDARSSRAAAINYLRQAVNATVSPRSGILTVEVTTTSPILAEQVARRVLDEVTRFTLETQHARMSAERQFAQRRLEEAGNELRDAERRFEAFLRTNRQFGNSPELMLREDALRRDVNFRQQIYTSLAQSVAQARMEEERDTPSITVIEKPELPLHAASRGIIVKSAFAGILGVIAGAALVLARTAAAFRRVGRRTAASTRQQVYQAEWDER